MVEVRKKPRESTSSLLRRFSQRVRESRILVNAKSSMFQKKKVSKTERRKEALERTKKRKERWKLKKLGRL